MPKKETCIVLHNAHDTSFATQKRQLRREIYALERQLNPKAGDVEYMHQATALERKLCELDALKATRYDHLYAER